MPHLYRKLTDGGGGGAGGAPGAAGGGGGAELSLVVVWPLELAELLAAVTFSKPGIEEICNRIGATVKASWWW